MGSFDRVSALILENSPMPADQLKASTSIRKHVFSSSRRSLPPFESGSDSGSNSPSRSFVCCPTWDNKPSSSVRHGKRKNPDPARSVSRSVPRWGSPARSVSALTHSSLTRSHKHRDAHPPHTSRPSGRHACTRTPLLSSSASTRRFGRGRRRRSLFREEGRTRWKTFWETENRFPLPKFRLSHYGVVNGCPPPSHLRPYPWKPHRKRLYPTTRLGRTRGNQRILSNNPSNSIIIIVVVPVSSGFHLQIIYFRRLLSARR